MTIVASDFCRKELSGEVEISCALKGEGFPSRLVYRLPAESAHAVDLEEPNWAAMALYWQAMMMGQDLVIEANLSPLLLHNMRGDLMALMRNYEPMLKEIRIEAGSSTPRIPTGPRDVMTGFSGGVDSFATFVRYTSSELPESLRLTALAVYQVGALGPTSAGDELLRPAVAQAAAQAREYGLNLYSLWSNMNEVYEPARRFGPIDFRRTVGLRNASAALLLQNGVRTYLPSGSVAYRSATYGPYSCTENMDPALQPLLATEKLRVQPAGAGLSRTDKIILLSDNPDAHRRLNVCVHPAGHPRPTTTPNCSNCWKCIQTMMTLEAIGKLEKFGAVFDLNHYRQHHRQLLGNLVQYATNRNILGILDQISYARQRGVAVPPGPGALSRGARYLRYGIRNRARALIQRLRHA